MFEVKKFGDIYEGGSALSLSRNSIAKITQHFCKYGLDYSFIRQMFGMSANCVISFVNFSVVEVEENKNPEWWLLSDEDVVIIKRLATDYIENTNNEDVQGQMKLLLYTFEIGLRSTNEVPDDFIDDKISDAKFDVDVANEIVNRIMDIFEKQNDTLTNIGEQIKLVNFGLTRVRNDIGGVTKKKTKEHFSLMRGRMRTTWNMFARGEIGHTELTTKVFHALDSFGNHLNLLKE